MEMVVIDGVRYRADEIPPDKREQLEAQQQQQRPRGKARTSATTANKGSGTPEPTSSRDLQGSEVPEPEKDAE